MKISGGTIEAIALLEKLQQEDYLVDVYSHSFFSRQPSSSDDPNADFTKEGFEIVLDEYENNPNSDLKPLGHLLFLHIDDYQADMRKSIVEIYKPLAKLIDFGKHNPDFLIINLFTKQILCIGLGRKNRLFLIDAATGQTVNAFGLFGSLHFDGLMTGEDGGYMERFTQHDVYEFVNDFIHAVHDLSVAMFNHDGMLANSEQIRYTIRLGPDEKDFYQLKDTEQKLIDKKKFTKQEITALLEQINSYESDEEQAMKKINVFFPYCDRSELNTGDY
jgi:hypothetical protein